VTKQDEVRADNGVGTVLLLVIVGVLIALGDMLERLGSAVGVCRL
jgi:hypothetical protein